MKTVRIKQENIDTALAKMGTSPYSLNHDSIDYRHGYIRALQDLGIIQGLSAARMGIEIEAMDWGMPFR